MADISVVCAARNVEDFIAETVQSVVSQDFAGWHLVLVIDSSTDRTGPIARDFALADARISVVEGDFGGVSIARNRGLEHVRSPHVLFLDGDDLLLPDALGRFVDALDRNDRAVAAVGGHSKIDEIGRPIVGEDCSARPPFPGPFPALLERNIIVNGGSIAIRTETARAVGGFDPELRIGEDWEFWVRLALQGEFVAMGQEATLLYRQRRQSAMTRERGPIFRLQSGGIDRIFANSELRDRFPTRDLQRWRRAAMIDLYLTATRAALLRQQWGRFLALAAISLLRYPDGLLKGYIWRFLGRHLSLSH